jgi:hemerythrin superfamily protein
MPTETSQMDALELLESQHDDVESLIEEIEETDDPDTKAQLFAELADNIAAHGKIEEKIFYPAVMSEETSELLHESTEEHLSVKRVLADMVELDCEDPQWDAKLSVVKEQIRHHARDEEEGELFPKVRKMMSKDELQALAGEMTRMFTELLEGEPRFDVKAETAAAAPLPG